MIWTIEDSDDGGFIVYGPNEITLDFALGPLWTETCVATTDDDRRAWYHECKSYVIQGIQSDDLEWNVMVYPLIDDDGPIQVVVPRGIGDSIRQRLLSIEGCILA